MSFERHVLLIVEEAGSAGGLRDLLARAGYRVTAANGVQAGLETLLAGETDLVLLDVGAPAARALGPIRAVSDVPVLVLAAEAGELEKVCALKGGADDYVTKPFGRQELPARIEALLRRAAAARPLGRRYVDATLTLDLAQRRLTVAGREVALTPLEFKLLATFVRHPNVVLSPERLLELVWSASFGGVEEVRTYVFYLRRKLRPADPIETVRGFGYRYRA